MSEAQITLAAGMCGLVAWPFAWRRVFARPVAPLAPVRSAADRSWPVAIAMVLLLVQFAGLGMAMRVAPNQPILARSILGGSIVVTAVAAWLLAPRLVQPTIRIPEAMGAGVLTMLAALPCVYGVHFVQMLFVRSEAKQELVERLQNRAPGWQEIAIAAVLLAPLAEELVFRVFLYGGVRRISGARVALLASALCFGLVHFAPPTTILPMFVFGLFLARLMERTGSYWACMTAHAAFNVFGVAAALAS